KNVTDYLNMENPVNILLVGSGSIEHAIAEAVKRSSIANKHFCISTAINPAIDKITQWYQIADICNCDEVLEYSKSQIIDISIIG
ncbi:phosphoribosylamine--glycine ligase, partial [Francisella tularensis subsp. holarctica]|nr:phosphoribosylamine--glycine ligase [Francisella tularensis subsp. holarctica]